MTLREKLAAAGFESKKTETSGDDTPEVYNPDMFTEEQKEKFVGEMTKDDDKDDDKDEVSAETPEENSPQEETPPTTQEEVQEEEYKEPEPITEPTEEVPEELEGEEGEEGEEEELNVMGDLSEFVKDPDPKELNKNLEKIEEMTSSSDDIKKLQEGVKVKMDHEDNLNEVEDNTDTSVKVASLIEKLRNIDRFSPHIPLSLRNRTL